MVCHLPDEFSDGPVLDAATGVLVGMAEGACPGWLCGTSFCVFFLHSYGVFIKPLFKYSFGVGLLLLLQCLNGSVHPVSWGETLSVSCSDQSSRGKTAPTSTCIYSDQLFQINLEDFLLN